MLLIINQSTATFSHYSGAIAITELTTQILGKSTLDIILQDTSCNGTENNILSCNYSRTDIIDTQQSIAGAVCQGEGRL